MPNFSRVEVEVTGARGDLILNEPERLNPLGNETLRAIVEAACWLDAQPGLKVVVVSGRGRVFSAGADVGAFGGAGGGSAISPRDSADEGRRMAEAVERMKAVTIAKIQGHCVGGGVVLASACDLRVAAAETSFRIPEVDIGIPLAWGGIQRLVRDIGPAMTKELVMTCRAFDAEEAKQIGFLNRVVALADLDAVVEELAIQLLDKAEFALLSTKRQTNAITDEMVSMSLSLNDADLLVAGLRDEEGRSKAATYLERLARRKG